MVEAQGRSCSSEPSNNRWFSPHTELGLDSAATQKLTRTAQRKELEPLTEPRSRERLQLNFRDRSGLTSLLIYSLAQEVARSFYWNWDLSATQAWRPSKCRHRPSELDQGVAAPSYSIQKGICRRYSPRYKVSQLCNLFIYVKRQFT